MDTEMEPTSTMQDCRVEGITKDVFVFLHGANDEVTPWKQFVSYRWRRSRCHASIRRWLLHPVSLSSPASPSLFTLSLWLFEASCGSPLSRLTSTHGSHPSPLLHHVTATSRAGGWSVCAAGWMWRSEVAWTCCSQFDLDNQSGFWISQRFHSCEVSDSCSSIYGSYERLTGFFGVLHKAAAPRWLHDFSSWHE